MPLYEYQCDACGERFEIIQKFADPPADVCARCGRGPVKKLVSSPAIQFKGSGWYITDYARKSGETAPAGGDGAKPADAAKPADGAKAPSPSSRESPAKSDAPASKSASGTKDS
jgi:putative FmdB family regulatory protein